MKIKLVAIFAATLLLCFAVDASAQGRGNSGGNGKGNSGGGGRPATAGPPASTGVDHGLGNASVKSKGRSDAGLDNASVKWNGKSDAGHERARLAKMKAGKLSDNDLNRYRGLSKKLGTTPEEMRPRYEAALLANPDLTYGNFVAANVIADNLGGRFPNVTSGNILSGLANGHSIGETLRDLRLTKEQAKDAQRDAEDKINAAKR